MDDLTGDRLAEALLTIGVAVTLVGGIGLATAGIGLLGERPSSGRVAMIVTALTSLTYWVICALFLFKTDSWSGGLVSGTFAATTSALFALAARSATVLRQHPPPPDQNVVTDEFLRQTRGDRSEDD